MNWCTYSSDPKRSHASAASLVLWTCLLLSCCSVCCNVTARADEPPTPHPLSGRGLTFAVADFDGDMLPDVASIEIGQSKDRQTDYWIQLQVSGTGRQAIRVVAPAGGLQVAARDVNGDDAPDLVLTTTWSQQPVAVYLNDGHGRFTRVEPSVFPDAFDESEASWSATCRSIGEAVGAAERPRSETCPQTGRCRHSAERLGAVASGICGIPRDHFLFSHLGRAPPLMFFLF